MPNEKDIFKDHRSMMITGEQRDSIMYIVGKLDGIMAACMLGASAMSPDGGYGEIDMCITCKKNGMDKYKDTETGQEWDFCEACPNNMMNAYKER